MNADEKSVAGAVVRVNAFFVYRRLTGDIQGVLVVENRDMKITFRIRGRKLKGPKHRKARRWLKNAAKRVARIAR